jgi:hypothetical protein
LIRWNGIKFLKPNLIAKKYLKNSKVSEQKNEQKFNASADASCSGLEHFS